ncbi:MAG: NADH-quinone oxidoreductase subunit NuoE [Planctomycetes bacterium]|nr:NADH-quinone oxidoreductase subunit NuoE [Planctomycetota bacterium]
MEPVASILAEHGTQRDDCIKLLQEIQLAYGYLPKDVLRYVSANSDITLRQIYSVATFYEWFRFQPVGKHTIRTCSGTACHVNGARQTTREVQQILGVDDRQTTEDGMFTLESVACLGCCSLAPVIMIGEEVHGRLSPKDLKRVIRQYRTKHGTGEVTQA